jgi:DNA-binding SARP family transcriptional activator
MSSTSPEGQTLGEERPGRETEAVRVWVLGGFRVSVGSRTIADDAWRLRKAAALVKLLALAPGHRLHREQIMDHLWPDSGKSAASNNLRKTLHVARRTLNPTGDSLHLVSQDRSLVLAPVGDLWVDVDAFEEAAAIARGSRDPSAYRAALDLYGGEPLPGDRYEEWAEEPRDSLRETYLSLVLGLARLHEERGEYEMGIESLQRAVAEEPGSEEAHVGLMRLFALSDRPTQALVQYERLGEALSGRLDTGPSREAGRLRDEIAGRRFPPTQDVSLSQEELLASNEHNLPAPRTSFVGREREMREVKRELAMTRLLTLIGAGGTGKTRLALEVARDSVGAYVDGVWLVELASLSEEALVPLAVASALDVREQPGRPLEDTLVDMLRHKQMLLVLDNCEHLVDSVAHSLDTLLDSCPRLKVLATSRVALGLAGEAIWRVSSLSTPDTDRLPAPEEMTQYDGVRLFLVRARLRSPSFELTRENALAVAEVCRKLDGIPLAIELATARVDTLSVGQISEKLDDALGLLSIGGRTVAPRQRTLRGRWTGATSCSARRSESFSTGYLYSRVAGTWMGPRRSG